MTQNTNKKCDKHYRQDHPKANTGVQEQLRSSHVRAKVKNNYFTYKN